MPSEFQLKLSSRSYSFSQLHKQFHLVEDVGITQSVAQVLDVLPKIKTGMILAQPEIGAWI